MEPARHPGHEFVQGYGPGLPTCTRTLARLVCDYADYLRHEAGQDGVPVDVDAIAAAFGLTVVDTDVVGPLGLDGANVDALGLVILSTDGPDTRRRFTLAHELVEKLVAAITGNALPGAVTSYLDVKWRKERLCHWGAAALLLPTSELEAALRAAGPVSLATASEIANRFDVSLVVAARALAERHGEGRTALIVWRLANKPTELRPGPDANQCTLFGDHGVALPPKAARVWWSAFPRHLQHVEVSVRHASSPAGSLVHTALTVGAPGVGHERLVIGKLDDVCAVDVQRVRAGDEPVALSLVRLPSSRAVQAPGLFGAPAPVT